MTTKNYAINCTDSDTPNATTEPKIREGKELDDLDHLLWQSIGDLQFPESLTYGVAETQIRVAVQALESARRAIRADPQGCIAWGEIRLMRSAADQ